MSGGSRPLTVLYGSQTGTAQEVAERVGREGKRYHFSPVCVSSLDGFPTPQLPATPLVVYVVSTTGQGTEPDNMARAWRFLLRKSLPATSLQGQSFCVLGLGDSSYPKFNHVAKKLARRLAQLGGTQLLSPGLADDQHDLGQDFVIDPFLQQFWGLALQLYPLPPGIEPLPRHLLPPPKYKVRWLDQGEGEESGGSEEVKSEGKPGPLCPLRAPLLSNQRLTPPAHFQDVRLVRLDMGGAGGQVSYRPGDVACVQPSNLASSVDTFFSLFPSLQPDRRFLLEPGEDSGVSLPPPSILPRPATVRQAVQSYFDIQAIPRRYFFELLSHFTEDELEAEKFMEFNTAEGQQDLYEYCNRPRRHSLEVLYDFRHTTPNIPFEYLFDLFPVLKPRSFSIASAPSKHGSVLELLVAVVRYRSSLKAPRLGVCSNWLASLSPGERVPLWLRPGTLSFPPLGSPLVMVGPGTGVAPFRSACAEAAEETQEEREKAEKLLFFGGRNRAADFFFSSEWAGLGVTVETAFSRDQEDKVYVQHRLVEQGVGRRVASLLLDQGASFFLAGNSKQMPGQVREALVQVLAQRLGEQGAEQYVTDMEEGGRYQTETWA